MPKVVFNIQYEINPAKRAEYLSAIKEYKFLLKAEGLISYSVFENNLKQNNFVETFLFESEEASESFEEVVDERLGILLDKIEDLKVAKSNKITTLVEVED